MKKKTNKESIVWILSILTSRADDGDFVMEIDWDHLSSTTWIFSSSSSDPKGSVNWRLVIKIGRCCTCTARGGDLLCGGRLYNRCYYYSHCILSLCDKSKVESCLFSRHIFLFRRWQNFAEDTFRTRENNVLDVFDACRWLVLASRIVIVIFRIEAQM